MNEHEPYVPIQERLRYGCVYRAKRWSGDTFTDLGGGDVDEPATDEVMTVAAAYIDCLEAIIAEYTLAIAGLQV
jgi:hypothetical protein